MKAIYFCSVFALAFVSSSGQYNNIRIARSLYNQTCALINYKCNNSETGLLKLKALSLKCLLKRYDMTPNCSELELIAYQEIACTQNNSQIKFVTNESFHGCKHFGGEKAVIDNETIKHKCSFIIPEEGLYVVELSLNDTPLVKGEWWDFKGRSKHGYLPTNMGILLIFYQVSFFVYLLSFMIWVASCWYFYKDLLQLQYYIALIVFLGLIEHLMLVIELEYLNRMGVKIALGAMVLGELISALKRALARVLVVAVSIGYGTVKPKLGKTLQKLVAAGLLYFIFSATEDILLQTEVYGAPLLLFAFGSVCMDGIFYFWIFWSLSKTKHRLVVKKNATKLSVYRHFTNTLYFALMANAIYFTWSLYDLLIKDCYKPFHLWIEEISWSFLFYVVLIMIMILWRPSVDNHRYAYSPLTDDDDDDDDVKPTGGKSFDIIELRTKYGNEAFGQQDKDFQRWLRGSLSKHWREFKPTPVGPWEVKEVHNEAKLQ